MEPSPIRVTKVQQGRRFTLEVAFVTMPNGLGAEMLGRISVATGLSFHRPVGNLNARKELHIAEVNADEETFDLLYLRAEEIAQDYGDVSETRQNLGAPEPGDEPMPINRRGIAARLKQQAAQNGATDGASEPKSE
jgi:hypothetical protein